MSCQDPCDVEITEYHTPIVHLTSKAQPSFDDAENMATFFHSTIKAHGERRSHTKLNPPDVLTKVRMRAERPMTFDEVAIYEFPSSRAVSIRVPASTALTKGTLSLTTLSLIISLETVSGV